MDKTRAAELHAKHGHCFFRFVLKEDLLAEDEDGRRDTLNLLIPLDSEALPFGGARRNVKIIKMLGHLIFPWAERLMWVDAKLVIGELDPLDVYESTVERRGVCASFMGLPTHANTFGKGRTKSFATHGETILRVSKGERVSVTDSASAVRTQVRSYTMETNHSAHLSDYMIDSAYMAWNYRAPRCRRFNAALGCWWLYEIQCFSDRDQLSFPYVLHKMGARWPSYTDPGILIDHNSRPVVHIIEPGTKFEAEDSVLHWYFSTAVAIIPGHESAAPLAKAKEEAKKRKTHDRSKESEHKHYMRKRAWLEHRKAKLAAMGIDTSTMSLRSSSSKYASLRSTSTPQFERGGL